MLPNSDCHRRSSDADMLVDINHLVKKNDVARLRQYAESGLLTESLVNQRSFFFCKKANAGSARPLWPACALGYRDVAEVLLQCGACVNATNEVGESPLWIASKEGKLDVVKLLLSHDDIEVDQPNYWGKTPLLAASGQIEVIRLLVEAGASLTYQEPRTGITVLHSCSGSLAKTACAALSYLLDGVPQPAPVIRNASGSLPVILAAAKGNEEVVEFWTKRACTPTEVEQAADAWELLTAQLFPRVMPPGKLERNKAVTYWRRAISLRAAITDQAQLSKLLQNKRAQSVAVAALQTRGPLVGVMEVVEADCSEAETVGERIEKMVKPLSDLIECLQSEWYTINNLEPVLQQCCLCSERVLGLAQRDVIYPHVIYAIWLEAHSRKADACEVILNLMARQLEELDKGCGSNRFENFSFIPFQIYRRAGRTCREMVTLVGPELVKLIALAMKRCKMEKSTVVERHQFLACFLGLVQTVFLSGDSVNTLSGTELVEHLDDTVVDAIVHCIRAKVCGIWNHTLLHVAVNSRTSLLFERSEPDYPMPVFPQLALTRLLVELGAPVNKTDSTGNLPLHLLLINRLDDDTTPGVLGPIVQCLVRAKSHLDIRNCKGVSCLDLAQAPFHGKLVARALHEGHPLPLLCLAAQVVHRSELLTVRLTSVLPKLKPFVLRH